MKPPSVYIPRRPGGTTGSGPGRWAGYERWRLGYLMDATRATGRAPELSAGHDGRIVSDIVAEWAHRHGRPFVLDISGPAGCTYDSRPDLPGAERISLDAVRFCRTLAGRAPATGLLATIVPF